MTDTITLPRSVVEQVLEDLEMTINYVQSPTRREDMRDSIEALRAALEQPQGEQEPVAWIENIGGGVSYNPYHEAARKLPDGVRFDLYPHPQPKRQPLTDEQQIAEAMRRHGLVLVKTVNGYDVLKLGQITAHGITGEAK